MEKIYGQKPVSVDEMWAWCEKYSKLFAPYICDVGDYLDKADREGKKIMFEAQLGALRDIDFGIYPYTSSSNTVSAYAPIGAGIPGHLLGRVDADGDIGHDVPAGTAQHPVDRGAVLLAQQIPQGHVHSGLGAGVVDKRLLHSGGQILKFIEVAAQQGRGDMILNGTEDGPGGVAGDDTGRGCFAVAHRTGIGVELHDNILNAVHSAQCRFERHPQRGGNAAQPHLCDLHSPVLLLIPAAGLPA